MNRVPKTVLIGTTGELLVQLRLWQFDVQSAPPLKDSGNDLIAVRGRTFQTLQVKTTAEEDSIELQDQAFRFKDGSRKLWTVLALVYLHGFPDSSYDLGAARIYLLSRTDVGENARTYSEHRLGRSLCVEVVEELWPRDQRADDEAPEPPMVTADEVSATVSSSARGPSATPTNPASPRSPR